jgi:prepilin-type N-terminal cleavage/methylation domain-containing protein
LILDCFAFARNDGGRNSGTGSDCNDNLKNIHTDGKGNAEKNCHAELVSASAFNNKILNQVQDDKCINSTAAAFTLIELLVVVLIIGILAAIALPKYQLAVAKSRATQALTVLGSIAEAQKIYYLINNKYATNMDDLDISLPGFVLCATSGGNRFYINGKYQFMTANDRWEIGKSTDNASCAVPYNGPVISAMIPGGYFGACPATNKDICLVCLAGSGSSAEAKRNRQVCESLGGKSSGIFNTNYVYKLN